MTDPFEAVPLGTTGKVLYRLGLGTAPLGGFHHPVAEDDARDVLSAAYRLGIRFYDTAPYYGHGRSERLVGEVLRQYDRDGYVLASKVGYLLRRGAAPHARPPLVASSDYERLFPIYDFSREGVRRSYEESMARLGLGRIDILHIHDAEEFLDQALAEAFQELAVMRSDGMIGAISAGSNSAGALLTLVRGAAFDCVMLANEYTLLNQTALSELLPLCSETNVSVIAAAVFHGGLLANPTTGETYSAWPLPETAYLKAKRLDNLCRDHGVPLAAAAVQFPFGHPAVKSVVIGARSVAELEHDVELFSTKVPSSLWDDMKATGLLSEDVPTP